MHQTSRVARFAAGIAVVVVAFASANPASASTPRRAKGQPSAAAIAAWSATYRAKERVYRAQLAARSDRSSLPSPAAIQAWSDDYRAMEDVYQRQQLAQAQREANAFNFDDAVVGGGIVLALAALAAAGLYVLRTRRLGSAPLS